MKICVEIFRGSYLRSPNLLVLTTILNRLLFDMNL